MSKDKKLIIGLTGAIGSGKSIVAKQFEELGIIVIDADQISREIVLPHSDLLKKIETKFGSVILNADGSLNRKKLQKIIFQDMEAKRWLEDLLHPVVCQIMIERAKQATSSYCVLVIPLLIELFIKGKSLQERGIDPAVKPRDDGVFKSRGDGVFKSRGDGVFKPRGDGGFKPRDDGVFKSRDDELCEPRNNDSKIPPYQLDQLIDRILIVNTNKTSQIKRIQDRDHLPKNDILKIIKTQVCQSERIAYANDIIDNTKDIPYLKKQVLAMHNQYLFESNQTQP